MGWRPGSATYQLCSMEQITASLNLYFLMSLFRWLEITYVKWTYFAPGKWPGLSKQFYTYYHCFLINANLTTIISAGLVLALTWQTSEIKTDLSNDLVQSPNFSEKINAQRN